MRTKSLREALSNLAEEAAELSAAASRLNNKRKVQLLWDDLAWQYTDVVNTMNEVRRWQDG